MMSLLCCVGAVLLSGRLANQANDCHHMCEGSPDCEIYGWDVITHHCYSCSSIRHNGTRTDGMVCSTQDASMTATLDTSAKHVKCNNVKGSYCIICPELFRANVSANTSYSVITGTWVDAVYVSGDCTRVGIAPLTSSPERITASLFFQFDAQTSHVTNFLFDGGGWSFSTNVTIDIRRGGITVRNIGIGTYGVIRIHESYNKRGRKARGFIRSPSQGTELMETIIIDNVQSQSTEWPVVQIFCNAPSRPTRLADLQIVNSRSDGGLVAAVGGMVTGIINIICPATGTSVISVLRRIPYGHTQAGVHDELVLHDSSGHCDIYDVSSEFSFWSYDYTVRDESSNGRLFAHSTILPEWVFTARDWLFYLFLFLAAVCIFSYGTVYAWIDKDKKTK